MKVLLDENLPRKLVAALRSEGHEVESVHTLELQGLENGRLNEFAYDNFDLCFTSRCWVHSQCSPENLLGAIEAIASHLAAEGGRCICFGFHVGVSREQLVPIHKR